MAGWASSLFKLVRSGLMDLDYYQAQTGKRYQTVVGAAIHFLLVGGRAGLSPHPLFEPEFLGRSTNPAEMVLAYLSDSTIQKTQSPHPLFDLKAARRQLRRSGKKPLSTPWLTWVRFATTETPVPTATGSPQPSWGSVRSQLITAAASWRQQNQAPPSHRFDTPNQLLGHTRGLTSIITPISGDLPSSLRILKLLRGEPDFELVCTGFSSRAQWLSFTALSQIHPLRLLPGSNPNVVLDWNHAAEVAAGEYLVFLAPGAKISAASVAALRESLADPGTAAVQPLNETPAMTIHSAGAGFTGSDPAPFPLLAQHPTSDAEQAGRHPIPALLSEVVAVRATTFRQLGGFNPDLNTCAAGVDLGIRVWKTGVGRVELEPGARVTVAKDVPAPPTPETARTLRANHSAAPPGTEEYLRAAGFVISGHCDAHDATRCRQDHIPGLQFPALTRPERGLQALPRLRWTIDTPVTAGWWAELWGDWHFAQALGKALRRLDQQVAIDTRHARGRPTRDLDDVLLVIRGRDVAHPEPGRVNLLWVISHPDDVSDTELEGFDRVFAASTRWARERGESWGGQIEPLLQCTDPELFNPGRARSGRQQAALFVGNIRSEDRSRPVVDAALAAGVALDLYGTGWEKTPAANVVKGRKVPNQELGRRYAEAGLVLADHWPDMRRHGFHSNRLFDSVACGARVLSDHPASDDESIFAGSVKFFDDAAEARALLQSPWDTNWPDAATRLETASRIRDEHSFDRRAEVLLKHAVAVLRNS